MQVADTRMPRQDVASERRVSRRTGLAAAATLCLLMLLGLMNLRAAAQDGSGALLGGQASQVRLYLLEDPGCPYCARWTAEVQPGYLKSPEGAFAPLIRQYRNDPRSARFERVNYSPTFVLVRGDEEIGRIVGYMGPDLFWVQLEELLKKAGFASGP